MSDPRLSNGEGRRLAIRLVRGSSGARIGSPRARKRVEGGKSPVRAGKPGWVGWAENPVRAGWAENPVRAGMLVLAVFLGGLGGSVGWSLPEADAIEPLRGTPTTRWLFMGRSGVALADQASAAILNPAAMRSVPGDSLEAFSVLLDLDAAFAADIIDPEGARNVRLEEMRQSVISGQSDVTHASSNARFYTVAYRPASVLGGIAIDEVYHLAVVPRPNDLAVRAFYYQQQQLFVSHAWSPPDERWQFGYQVHWSRRRGLFLDFDRDAPPEETVDTFETRIVEERERSDAWYSGSGVDLGVLYRFGEGRWAPRVGFASYNFGGGVRFGPRLVDGAYLLGLLPPIQAVGVALAPVYWPFRFSLALDVVDVGDSYGEGRSSLVDRTRLGLEFAYGPRRDGTAQMAFLVGWHGGALSAGVIAHIGYLQFGAGNYVDVERLGDEDLVLGHTLILLALQF